MGEIVELHSAGSGGLRLAKLNSSSGGRSHIAALKAGKCLAGISPRVFQFVTLAGRTPAIRAALTPPPTALTRSLIERIMAKLYNTQAIYRQGVNRKPVDEPLNVNFHSVRFGWGATMRDRVAARLRQLPGVLGKQDFELAEICGVSRQAWSNYKSTVATNEIPPEVAMQLWQAFGIPMMWFWGGDASTCPDPELRIKLHQADRAAAAELAPKPKRGPAAHIALTLLAGSFLLVACAEAGTVWKRIDSSPVASERIEADKLVCKGEAAKANLSSGNQMVYAPDTFGWSGGMRTVYTGCMAEKGYLRERP